MDYLVTGAAGFIGSNLAHYLISLGHRVIGLDKLTYAGCLASLAGLPQDRFTFVKADVCNMDTVFRTLKEGRPDYIFHLAAESHVDRSIDGPGEFIKTNIYGTFSMLSACRRYYESLDGKKKENFHFLHISTDEVYGSLGDAGYFTEETPYAPNSPYSASKASSDHLARAWFHTYSLPVITTKCSNNYGPRQFPEKLIPLVIHNALAGKPIPVYGDGKNIRDWLYVEDHCKALYTVMTKGVCGETYNIGGSCEMQNIDIVKIICAILGQLRSKISGTGLRITDSICNDRPGHDRRYAIYAGKIKRELVWQPTETFSTGIRKTIDWHLGNTKGVNNMLSFNILSFSGKYECERLEVGGGRRD